MLQRAARTFLLLVLALVLQRPLSARAVEVVAVLPMVVHSSGDRTQLREGLADMLASRLGRQPGISVLRVAEDALATTSAEAAAAAGRKAGASWVVFGSFTHFGDGASLDVRCVSADGKGAHDPRSIFIQSGSIGEIIPRLDTLTGKLGRYMSTGGEAPAGEAAAGAAEAPRGEAAESAELKELRLRVQALEARIDSRAPEASKEDLARSPGAAANP